MKIIKNTHKNKGLPSLKHLGNDKISTNAESVLSLLNHCPAYKKTPLTNIPNLANSLNIKNLLLKDERNRMNLGSFKALGASYVIAKRAYEKAGESIFNAEQTKTALQGETFVTASAGNHGLSLAVGANIFGAKAIIYLSRQVPQNFAENLRARGAEVIIEGDDYEASMEAACLAAEKHGWYLLSDSTWEGYDVGVEVMEGYSVIGYEIVAEVGDEVPTHVFLQAGVGGLAAAMAAYFRRFWGDDIVLVIVEPTRSPALQASIEAGELVSGVSQESGVGLASNMGRLDCKDASLRALQNLAYTADYFVTLSDEACLCGIESLALYDMATTPSGGAGFAALWQSELRESLDIGLDSGVLCIISECA